MQTKIMLGQKYGELLVGPNLSLFVTISLQNQDIQHESTVIYSKLYIGSSSKDHKYDQDNHE